MNTSMPTSGKPGLQEYELSTECAGAGAYCPFKQPVTQDSTAAGVVLASILPLLEVYGQSLASPQTPFPERKCPMLKCEQRLKTPWSFINHLLLCSETSKGDVSCQKCTFPHVEKRLTSTVHLLKQLSGRKRRYRSGTALDFPVLKRGRVDGVGGSENYERLPTYEELLGCHLPGGGAQKGRHDDALAELDATEAELEALVDRLFPESAASQVPRQPLQQSWPHAAPQELAAGPVMAPPRPVVELYTPHSRAGNFFPSTPAFGSAMPEEPWSSISGSTVWGTSPTEARLQQQTRADLMYSEYSSQHRQGCLDPSFGYLKPTAACVPSHDLAPKFDEYDPLEMTDGGDEKWFFATDYSEARPVENPCRIDNTAVAAQPTAYMPTPNPARLTVVTQPSQLGRAFGRRDEGWPLGNTQLPTPVSSIPSTATMSAQSVKWGPFSHSHDRPSISTESPTKLSHPTLEAPGRGRRKVFDAGRPGQPGLVSPLTAGAEVSEDNVSQSPCTEHSTQHETCPYCGYQPKRRKNRNTHMSRHIKTHEAGHGVACDFPGCGTIIAAGRKDNLRQHMLKAHNQHVQSDSQAARKKYLDVPSVLTPAGTPKSAFLGYGDLPTSRRGSWAGRFEDDGSQLDSGVLSGIASGRDVYFDSMKTPGGLSPVEKARDDLESGVGSEERPSDLGPTGWNSSWI